MVDGTLADEDDLLSSNVDPTKYITSHQRKLNAISTNKGTLRYPEDNEASSGMWFIMDEYEYSRPSLTSDFNAVPTGRAIALPMPTVVDATHNADWNTTDLGAWGNFLQTDVAPGMIQGLQDVAAGKSSLEAFANNLKDNVTWEKTKSATKAVATDWGTNTDIFRTLSASTGLARNPFTAAVYTGVRFRNFSFSWKINPRSYKESQTIQQIYKTLKFGMHPSMNAKLTNNLFHYPNIYKPTFSHPEFLFNFEPCVIRNCTISYQNEGLPLYFGKDDQKMPASMVLQLELMEMIVLTKETMVERDL